MGRNDEQVRRYSLLCLTVEEDGRTEGIVFVRKDDGHPVESYRRRLSFFGSAPENSEDLAPAEHLTLALTPQLPAPFIATFVPLATTTSIQDVEKTDSRGRLRVTVYNVQIGESDLEFIDYEKLQSPAAYQGAPVFLSWKELQSMVADEFLPDILDAVHQLFPQHFPR